MISDHSDLIVVEQNVVVEGYLRDKHWLVFTIYKEKRLLSTW